MQILRIFLCVLISTFIQAQDTLYLKSGDVILTDILGVSSARMIRYKAIGSTSISIDSIDRAAIYRVGVASGDYFPNPGASIKRKALFKPIDLALQCEAQWHEKWNPLTGKMKLSRKDIKSGKYSANYPLSSLVLIDRYPKKAIFVDTADGFLYFRLPGKLEIKEIELDKVYSVRRSDASEKILYSPDTLENNWLSASEMEDYIKGQQDAQRYYKIRPALSAMGGFFVGAAGSALGMFIGPVTVLSYTGFAGYTLPGSGKLSGFNPAMKSNAAYREGFGTAAKRKTVKKAALWSAIGYVGGLSALTIVLSQK
ncbi:MAG: hypothetical protein ACK5B6_12370 [Bacteroidia bacterium]|jgi:hypothetical protein